MQQFQDTVFDLTNAFWGESLEGPRGICLSIHHIVQPILDWFDDSSQISDGRA